MRGWDLEGDRGGCEGSPHSDFVLVLTEGVHGRMLGVALEMHVDMVSSMNGIFFDKSGVFQGERMKE